MKVKVIYPKRPEWNEADRREFEVGEVQAETPEEACEMIFAGFNNVIEDPQPGELGYWSNKFRIRSMSVGDLVEVDDVLYRCMSCGFQKVEFEDEIPAGAGIS
jgi:hypothetical protein